MDDELVEARFDLANDRIDHLADRVSALEDENKDEADHEKHRHGLRLEWIVIVLVALEAAFEVLMYFHPHA
ncbi:hypothetical protein [Paraburkholderia atlantica]|uniref:hypothetical protein n=1 Tax=Paraburkholderia atlantica TaxID=2654982 RepID=UPI001618010C|nr:hypothetical protein [Paraburkholderia atlantica]MBB5509552.1 putative Rmd1/YagE family protein [Paraburkholderia atlantica]